MCWSWWERLTSCGSSCKVHMKQLFNKGKGNKGAQQIFVEYGNAKATFHDAHSKLPLMKKLFDSWSSAGMCVTWEIRDPREAFLWHSDFW